ncbi:PLP-dependent aminotransferase family protein [Rhodococcus sp. 06-156-3C]|nr:MULTISPECIES: PLP-dependent aminotransferase family protein [unclassified Rhodococcus (in: high G+C Gram-positive bacteria)]OZD13363.1 PLP-dependent aminotransferase family protein [Rhodococcus sp. 06-156-3C]OZD28710.1 PLP-dependent aminotransferase family protein [Rhodococcus sp. 06-156-3]OZD34897.1 PLP-dependent aminotransferase family protein [Rhodococcus sp. 06-156-3b]OZF69557.1 PLP-dependent aminotransferase family protein [Rhodococcus sp. 06-156-4]OZD14005.1 PLP-dependent aminotransfe
MLPMSLIVSVDRTDPRTLPVQIADGIRAAIDSARIEPNTRLPSSRALSVELEVARGVVESAYDQLTAEGWLQPRAGSGTFVRRLSGVTTPTRPSTTSRTAGTTETLGRIRLATGTPWVPPSSAAWKRAWRDVSAVPQPQEYPDPRGDHRLRAALADLLGRARGLHTSAESIVVTTGSMHGMSLALAALSTEDGTSRPVLAHENPGYRVATTAARRWGWSVFDVPVDLDGIVTERLDMTPRTTRAVYVTPSHQYPTGGLLTVGRRRALASYARSRDAMIIEDDYDSEFRYDVAPLPTIAELAPDRTVYLGTVAKTLGGGIRLGWLVAPPDVVELIAHVRTDLGDYPSTPVQHAMLSLLRDGEWDRTVRAARRVYRQRDRLVAAALAPFGELRGVGAGMHTTLLLDATIAVAVAERAAAAGVDVDTLAGSTRSPSPVTGLIVGYGSVSDDELAYGLDVLVDALTSVS